MALLAYWYPDTFEFNRIFPNLDHLFATLEFDLFGCQPALLFDQVCSGLFWREAFNMGYWLYYPMIALVSFYYFFCRPKEAERCTFVIMASFFLYYIVYIFLYFSAMVATILVAMKMKKAGSQKHATVIATVVFGNIAVWFVEQFISWNFEFLSVSYLMSELIFLALYWMMQDYVHIQHAPAPIVEAKVSSVIDIATMAMDEKIKIVLARLPQGEILAVREREILEKILENKKRKDIADELKKAYGVEIDKRKIVADGAIKAFGSYTLDVKLYPEILGKVNLVVCE